MAATVFDSRARRGAANRAARLAAAVVSLGIACGSMPSWCMACARRNLPCVKSAGNPGGNLSLTDPTPAMHALLLIFPVLAFAALAAHFYRAGSWSLMLMSLVLIVLLAWPRAWVARLVQVGLVAGALEWVWTALGYVQQRMALGQPWSRLALILAAVAVFTAAAALVFRHPRLRARFALA